MHFYFIIIKILEVNVGDNIEIQRNRWLLSVGKLRSGLMTPTLVSTRLLDQNFLTSSFPSGLTGLSGDIP